MKYANTEIRERDAAASVNRAVDRQIPYASDFAALTEYR
jgi:hypothetical protein